MDAFPSRPGGDVEDSVERSTGAGGLFGEGDGKACAPRGRMANWQRWRVLAARGLQGEGVERAGTVIESRTMKVSRTAVLFLRRAGGG
jgi:hypothetical protein